MSKRKGLSAEEKKNKMLQLFHEKKDFFQLKDLEKIAPKEKGIIVQSVKDVVQSLVDDNLVKTDKIGTSIYFWAFPSDAKLTKKVKFEELQKDLASTKSTLEKTHLAAAQLEDGLQESAERARALKENERLQLERTQLIEKIQCYSGIDPEEFDQKNGEIQVAKDAANRWTDNVFSIRRQPPDKLVHSNNCIRLVKRKLS
ncbi:Meiotic coiled-coil protein [Nesidiocoris tenuis]|uniref:Meiotic nuclear division protein 1 homolog n=1 Tax=Nesidiocoris tenuis TaxID=355587 RepID=A0ABN7AEZ4_9HEMI|nr:Meiotic coiled-coil protein [Nesidiocoris tenuis]